jgi:hypothetical protein
LAGLTIKYSNATTTHKVKKRETADGRKGDRRRRAHAMRKEVGSAIRLERKKGKREAESVY